MPPTLVSEFERVAASHPERSALRTEDGSLSYAELAARVRAASGPLREQRLERGDVPDAVAAVVAQHGLPTLVGFLAALRAGFVVAVQSPDEKPRALARRLEHLEPALVVCDEDSSSVASRATPDDCPRLILGERKGDLEVEGASASGDAPAFLIDTSGSTGAPRAVVHAHASMLENVRVHVRALAIQPGDRALLLASMGTIAGITDTFRILLSGAELWPLDLRRTALGELATRLRAGDASIVHLVPTVFRRLVSRHGQDEPLRACRLLHLGGEPSTRLDFELFRQHLGPEARLLNNLGSSEVPTFRQSLLGRDTRWQGDLIPLRDAVPGKQVVLLDADGVAIPEDRPATGEIAVDTAHAALGYWRDPEATSRAFVPLGDGRIRFRTGDVARREPDGALVHLGRSDRALKMTGRWVDLAGLEAALLLHPAVREAVIVPVSSSEGLRLQAFCAADGEDSIATLRTHLREAHPSGDLVGAICLEESLPALPNGKLDRRALRARAEQESASPGQEASAESFTEQRLMELWAQVLPESRSAPTPGSHFADAGGDSLSALELVHELELELGIAVPPALLFEAPTLRELALEIDRLGRSSESAEYLYFRPAASASPRAPLLFIGDHRPMSAARRAFGPEASLAHLRLDGVQTPHFRRLSIDAQADAYERELSAAGIERPAGIVGFSYGGLVAFALAATLSRRSDPPPLLLLEPSIPGHPAPEAGGTRLRSRMQVGLAALRSRLAGRNDWERFRASLWRNVRRHRPEPLRGKVCVVAGEGYLARWEPSWRALVVGELEVRALRGVGSDHFAAILPEHHGSWLPLLEAWHASS